MPPAVAPDLSVIQESGKAPLSNHSTVCPDTTPIFSGRATGSSRALDPRQ